MNLTITRALIVALVVFAASQTASAQLVAPAAPAVQPTTIWNRLGIPYGFNKVRDNRINRRGNNPQWERTPPLKAIADPANLESPNSAIAKAAEVKAKEDLAPQKIKAIKYLAQMGCGCYDKDKSITKALLEAMNPVEECTPEVRLATIEAIREAIEDGESVCGSCGSTCCCNEDISLALSKSAYERDDSGCYYEPDPEIRQAAAELLRLCCPGRGPVNIIELPADGPDPNIPTPPPTPEPLEDPDVPPVPENLETSARNKARFHQPVIRFEAPQQLVAGEAVKLVEPAMLDTPATTAAPAELAPSYATEVAVEPNYDSVVELAAPPMLPVTRVAKTKAATLRAPQPTRNDHQVSFTQPAKQPQVAQQPRVAPQPAASTATLRHGVVAHVDASNGVIHLQTDNRSVMQVGTKLTVYHSYLTGKAALGQIEVVQSTQGAAIARPVGLAKTWKMASGDEAFVTR